MCVGPATRQSHDPACSLTLVLDALTDLSRHASWNSVTRIFPGQAEQHRAGDHRAAPRGLTATIIGGGVALCGAFL
jgi:hypothetical protein